MERVLQIWLEASIQAHHFIPCEYWESKVSDMRELYIPNSDTYVYEQDGAVQGFIALHEKTIAAIFVSPDCQNQGIGSRLMAQAKELHSSVLLTVYKENSKAMRFYKKSGFTVVQEQLDAHTGHLELLMRFP